MNNTNNTNNTRRTNQNGHAGLPTVVERLEVTWPSIDAPYRLSDRELSVLYLLTEGLSDKQVALALGITNYTVNKHVGAILTKLDVRSRTAAAVFAIRKHMFEDDVPYGRGTPLRSVSRRRYGPAA